jgi:hypothetical protein
MPDTYPVTPTEPGKTDRLKKIADAHSRCLELQQRALTQGRQKNDLVAKAAASPQWNSQEVMYLLGVTRLRGVDFVTCKKERAKASLPHKTATGQRLQLVVDQHKSYTELLADLATNADARRTTERETERATADRASAIHEARRAGIKLEDIASELGVSLDRVDKMSRQDRRTVT